jgi:hypothetical protein
VSRVFGNTQVKVAEVFWVPETKTWEVQWRPVTDDGETGSWAHLDGPEDELAQLISIMHDGLTGG